MADAPGNDPKGVDYSFGQVAIKENLCTFDQVKECLDIQAKLRTLGIEPKKLGDILIEKGYLTVEKVEQVAKLQSAAPSTSHRLAIPGYEMLGKIGQGGMGIVYKARQLSMDRLVAIKILSGKFAKDPSFVERFFQEARAVARLNHENLISGIDVGEVNGVRYFVMEFVDGTPLMTILRKEGRFAERRCLEIGLMVAKALHHAHRHSIIHRDVKPENIMMTRDGVAKLCDLGLAKQVGTGPGETADGTSVGTPHYISPEQARGEVGLDIRTDIYSLGASLFHLATGMTPFSGSSSMVIMTKHVTEQVESPRKRRPELSEGFSDLVLKMMEKRREERYQDPAALMAAIEGLIRGGAEITLAASSGTPSPAAGRPKSEILHVAPISRRSLLRSRTPASMTGVFIFAGVFVVALVIWMMASGGSGSPPSAGNHAPQPPPVVKDPTPAPTTDPDATARAEREIQEFRSLVESLISDPTNPERFTRPYRQIHDKIDEQARGAQFAGERAWREELAAFTKKVNAFIDANVWHPIKQKAEEHYGAGRHNQALLELATLEEVYKWFRAEGKPERTEAGKGHAALAQRINDEIKETFVTRMNESGRFFSDPAKRDEAYRVLDTLAVTGTASQKGEVEKTRERYFKDELSGLLGASPASDHYAKAQARLKELLALHSGNSAAQAVLTRASAELEAKQRQMLADAGARLGAIYADFLPKYDKAMQDRDLAAARACLHAVYVAEANAAAHPALFAGGLDPALVKGYLDPDRAAFADLRKLVPSAEQAIAAGAPARDLLLDLRAAALLEELFEQALEGSKIATRDAGRFRTGYSDVLRDSTLVAPTPRRARGGISLDVTATGGKGTLLASLTPRTPPMLSEDDIVSLARRSYSTGADSAAKADKDPYFALKAFLLYYHAARFPAAKSWSEKLTTPETQLGLAKYAAKLAGATSEREEQEVMALFKEATDLIIGKKRDEALAAKKFNECVTKYGSTEFMRAKAPTGKTRTEVAEGLLATLDGGKHAVKSKAAPKEVFGATDVRDTPRGKEITYEFKDDKELSHFNAQGVNVSRAQAGGLRLQGTGAFTCGVPFKGNITIEVALTIETDTGIGFMLHGDGTQTGYAAFVDYPVGGGQELDAILRLPFNPGGGVLQSIVASGGRNLQTTPNTASTARFERVGTRLRFAYNQGSIEGENPQYTEGKAGLALPPGSNVLLQRFRITGDVDKAWLDAEAKKLESSGK